MSKFAADTSVSAESSRAEIERTLQRYGADQFIEDVRFIERTSVEDRGYETPCWIWTGTLHDQGYPRISVQNVVRYVHRLIADVVYGIPDGWTVDHLCRVTSCWNPAHLEPVTRGENVLRGMGARAVAWRDRSCTKGHPMWGDNLYTSPKGQTQCRTCRRVRHRLQSQRRREQARAAA